MQYPNKMMTSKTPGIEIVILDDVAKNGAFDDGIDDHVYHGLDTPKAHITRIVRGEAKFLSLNKRKAAKDSIRAQKLSEDN